MRTALCDRLGIDVPVIQAAVATAASPAHVAAVSNAGALGMLQFGWLDSEAIRDQISRVRAATDRPFGAGFVLDGPQEERLELALEAGIRIISLFWGDPAPYVARVHGAGALLMHAVGSGAEARQAVEAGVDIVIAQGWEAGGHVRGEVGTLALVPAVVDTIAPVPAVAAGGIADGWALAAVLSLGGAGAWMGTRFLMAAEANVHPHYQAALVPATAADTFVSTLFDAGWEDPPGRTLRNSTARAWDAAGRAPRGQRPGEGETLNNSPTRGTGVRYEPLVAPMDAQGDVEASSLWAGQCVGLVSRRQPAGEIVREIVEEARDVLSRLAALQ